MDQERCAKRRTLDLERTGSYGEPWSPRAEEEDADNSEKIEGKRDRGKQRTTPA